MSTVLTKNAIDYSEFSNSQIANLIKNKVSSLLNSAAGFYRHIEDNDFHKKAIYCASDRIDFAIAFKVLGVTYVKYLSAKNSLSDLVDEKKRKDLIKIHKFLSDFSSYSEIRDLWKSELESVYCIQKETLKYNKLFLKSCAVCFINNRYLSLQGEKPFLTTNQSLAVEFPILSMNDSDLERIKSIVLDLVSDHIVVDKIKVAFQNKMECRDIYMG